MNTPDTEWREALEGRLFAYLGAMNMLGVMEGKTTDGTIVQRDKAVDDILQIVQTLLTSRDTYWKERVRKEVEERDALLREVNIPQLIEKMKEDTKEYGQYHDDDCPQMSEWADIDSECSCETIKVMKSFAEEWMAKVNEWWVFHAKEHRKLCTPEGNKMLTRMMGKKNRPRHTTY